MKLERKPKGRLRPTLSQIKLISIDTSVFGELAQDYFSNNDKPANNAIKFLVDNALVPFFSIHHFAEHLQCADDSAVDKRLSLIRSLPIVAWIAGGVSGLPGSIMDLVAGEIILMLGGTTAPTEILQKSKQDFIRYGSGEELIEDTASVLLAIRKLGYFDIQKAKSIDSLVHVADRSILNTKLYDLRNAKKNSPAVALQTINSLKNLFVANLDKSGDKKICDTRKVADWFIEKVKESSKELLFDSDLGFYEHLLASNGLKEEDINENTTIADLGELSTHRHQLDIISRSYAFDLDSAYRIPMMDIPSKYITTWLEKCIRLEARASGSNVIDKYMAAFSLYVDLNIADKRIVEYISQLRRKDNPIAKEIKHVVKVPHYSKIADTCKALL